MAPLSIDINVDQIVSIKRYEAVELSEYDDSYKFTPQQAIIKRRWFGPNVTGTRPAGYTTRNYFRGEDVFTSSQELVKKEENAGKMQIGIDGKVYWKHRVVFTMSNGEKYTKWFLSIEKMDQYINKATYGHLILSNIKNVNHEKA